MIIRIHIFKNKIICILVYAFECIFSPYIIEYVIFEPKEGNATFKVLKKTVLRIFFRSENFITLFLMDIILLNLHL